jgi:hypothetical protein
VPVIWVTAVAVTFTVVAAFTVFKAEAVTAAVATVIVYAFTVPVKSSKSAIAVVEIVALMTPVV